MKTREMILCGIFAALNCVFSTITLPIGAVPITMGVFGILLSAIILGPRHGTIAVLIFILLGAIGLPVFSGFKGGISVLFGATGGYIISYVFMALIVGKIADISIKTAPMHSVIFTFFGCMPALFICHFCGAAQLMLITHSSLSHILFIYVYPFIAIDLLKCIAAAILGCAVRRALVTHKVI